ncbi:hypothetical protein BKP64_05910 [Marinobacter salinus]|uniref:DUF2946 domain-containing protein n=1 Tax=Marinobacter salinus TaxID=1874317 RepID=A0A1D9GJE1_9GAMM|nr:hypothetical protein [Marinobacter salinus]AOY87743.1 hypothetical protein BKP64_05910 [Marinobacter salinus]
MSYHQLIAALLGVLLLLVSPTQAFATVASEKTGNRAVTSLEDCNGMDYARGAMGHSDLPINCDNDQQTSCHLTSAHCASTPVYGVTARTLTLSMPTKNPANAEPGLMVYEDPVGEVLTPSPDTLS